MIRRLVATVVALAAVVPAPSARAAAEVVTVTVDPAQDEGAVNPRVGGMVMIVRDPDLPIDVIRDLGLTSGRFDTWHFRTPNPTMPQCWTGTEQDFELLDPYMEWGLATGVDPERSHFRIAYLAACHLTGPVDDSPVGQALEPWRLYSAYPPLWAATIYTNPEAVEDMLYDLMVHQWQNYGIRTFAIWTEPDGLHPMPPHTYFQYYRLAHNALKRAEADIGADLRIGGPVTSFQDFAFMFLFLDFIIRNELDLDSLIFHRYIADDGQPTSETFRTAIRQVRDQVQTMAANRGADWLDPEIHINEWGFDPTGRNPANVDPSSGAFVASTLTTFLDEDLDAGDYFFLQDNYQASCDPSCSPLTDFTNYGTLDSDGNPRGSYHAFRMFSELGPTRVQATPSFESPGGRQEWGALATKAPDGSLRILLRNWDPDRSGLDLEVEFDLGGFQAASWRVEDVGIDTRGEVEQRSGTGAPPRLDLPVNQVTLLVVEPA